jgi:hypothetical protein
VNAFSIQTNTNYFNCSTCSSGKPFAAVTGVSNSASATGDQGWVQFVYQNYASSARLCVWNIDLTIASNTNSAKLPGSSSTWGFANSGYAGYNAACVAVPTTYPLTGSGAANGEGEVIGYITSCPANSNSGCLLEVVGYLPWGGDQGWWSIGTKDAMGLSGNWTNVSGTILGSLQPRLAGLPYRLVRNACHLQRDRRVEQFDEWPGDIHVPGFRLLA